MWPLSDDVFSDVLRRVAPRGLAMSRCVCREWRDLIDGRHLLRSDLLPHTLAGLFINYNELCTAELFRRPSVDLAGHYMPRYARVRGHCNGVLLLYNGLLNPAARWWVPLPTESMPPPHCGAGMERFGQDEYLVFDPTESPHCEVFLIPRVRMFPCVSRHNEPGDKLEPSTLGSEWPPSPCTLNVFSTMTGRWAERSFSRQGKAAGTVADMQGTSWLEHHHSVYWRRALYVHSEKDFVMRISLSDDTYRMIPPPCGITEMCDYDPVLHLGRSEKGVYCALLDDDRHLLVWVLDESCNRMEWVLRHVSSRGLFAQPSLNSHQVNGPWILGNANHHDNIEEPAEGELEWNSDDEDVLISEDGMVENHQRGYLEILGFHPYKEIVFLDRSLSRGLAYHLNTSKLEDLGNIWPVNYSKMALQPLTLGSYPYTPCMMGELPVSNS